MKNCLVRQLKSVINNENLDSLKTYLYYGETNDNFTITTGLPPVGTPIYAEVTNLDESFGFFTVELVDTSYQKTYIIENERIYQNTPITGDAEMIDNIKHLGVNNSNGRNVLLKIWY